MSFAEKWSCFVFEFIGGPRNCLPSSHGPDLDATAPRIPAATYPFTFMPGSL